MCDILPFLVSGKKPSTSRPSTKSQTSNSTRTHSNPQSQCRDIPLQQQQRMYNQLHQPPNNQSRKNSLNASNANVFQQPPTSPSANAEAVPSYMRSTSSSTKKSLSSVPISPLPQYQHPQLSGHLANRHLSNRAMIGQAQSTSDLRQAIKDDDSSSDDDTSSLNPTRRRSSSHDRYVIS